ncbi:Mitogen-activated protein kinase kinase kinase 7 [Lunasporangiospora selenospora]|uniref:Mitogen-activated protein kinase kinase kinase 7 n=1 Tax=Lunasporangiospora selenospora TaxID=979761 RepID=A0A9P6FWZ9_9FUNG|nr:Mitogen-activated protein kinase kinase kinase 7 [Lunasporangiospora selenospora]
MTVPVTPDEQEVLHVLRQCCPQIPFEEIDHIIYNAHVPGRFGNVHTGRWQGLDVEIREPFGDLSTIEREVRLLYKLGNSCPQIQRLHGFTIDPVTLIPYLIVQHNEHGSLHAYLMNFHPHLTWPDRYNLAMDIALGLRYLHHKGYRHRHIHSASILVDTNGSAVLADFGMTKDSEVISSREHTARMAYIAPERLTKNGTRYSIECDIYALGMVFWEIASGRPPFEDLITACNHQNDGSLMNLAQNIISGRRERHVEDVDPIFEDLYTRCWQPNPLERPSIEWIIQALAALLKQPSNSIIRQIEDLSLEEQPKKPAYSAKASSRDSHGSIASRSVKSSRSHSLDNSDRDSVSTMLRSQELIAPPSDYIPAGSHAPPPPIPPVSHRRKMSAVSSMAPSMRSMSISSGSSSGSSSHVPAIPARDSRRVSTLSSTSSTDNSRLDQHQNHGKRRSAPTIWEACQEGNVELVEWAVLSYGTHPNTCIALPQYSMLAEVAPIHIACFYQPDNLVEILRTLQRLGANMSLVTTLTNQTALHILLEHATNYDLALEASTYLINECRMDANDADSRGVTPFHKYLKNPNLSDRPSVVVSELFSLLRDRGAASLVLESLHDGNALGMTARYLRVDLMKLFLLTELSLSDPKSLVYAINQVELPLGDGRTSKASQDQCRSILMEWTGDRGETKRIQMAERILEHQGIQVQSGFGAPLMTQSTPPGPKGRKHSIGLLNLGRSRKASKEELVPAVPALPIKAASDVEVARKILKSTTAKQQKLKTFMAQSGF